jgi:hypothetical protein
VGDGGGGGLRVGRCGHRADGFGGIPALEKGILFLCFIFAMRETDLGRTKS